MNKTTRRNDSRMPQRHVASISVVAMSLLSVLGASCGVGADEGSLDEGSLDEAQGTGTSRDELQASMRSTGKHCVAEALAVAEGQPVPATIDTAEPRCFGTFAEAISAATKGAVKLDSSATPETFDASALALPATYVIGTEYKDAKHKGASLTVTSKVSCVGYAFLLRSMPRGWDNVISSARAFSGCNHSVHFEHTEFRGASKDCGSDCAYIGNAMNDRTSSIRWSR